MIMAKKQDKATPKRPRPRVGLTITVDLKNVALQEKLTRLVNQKNRDSSLTWNKSALVRELIREAKEE
jgi:hypothetical protein